jgi:ABC-type multidrug transport system fused ATPase/permease subunit
MMAHMVFGIVFSLKDLIEVVPRLTKLMLPAERVFALLESTSRIEPMPGDTTSMPFETKNGGIEYEFDQITFAYPTLPEHNVLRNLSLHVPAGKTVALVGERGCGKSSTIELMKRALPKVSICNAGPLAGATDGPLSWTCCC